VKPLWHTGFRRNHRFVGFYGIFAGGTRLRGRIRRELLEVEQLYALTRDIFYGKRGRINARELQEMNSCSYLTLIVACIVYWQGKEIACVVNECDPQGDGIDVSLLEHVSPIEWDNTLRPVRPSIGS
jgi:hypothetical protein